MRLLHAFAVALSLVLLGAAVGFIGENVALYVLEHRTK